jgi:hypothetical protein
MLDANHQQIWMIASPVAQPPPIRLTPLHLNTMGDAANRQHSVLSESLVGASNWGGSANITKKHYFYTRQSTGLWRIASPVALPPLIQMLNVT